MNYDQLQKLNSECGQLLDGLNKWMEYQIQVSKSYNEQLQRQNNSNDVAWRQETDANRSKVHQTLLQTARTVATFKQHFITAAGSYLNCLRSQLKSLETAVMQPWLQQQKASSYGAATHPGVDSIASPFQKLMEHSFSAWKFLDRVCRRIRSDQSDSSFEQATTSLFQGCYEILNALLQKSFLVSWQPALVVKNRILISVRLLAARRELGLESQPPIVVGKVISEETGEQLCKDPTSINSIQASGTMEGRRQELEYLESAGVFGAEFRRTKITVQNRRSGGRGGEAIRKKYLLLFTTELSLHHERGLAKFQLWTLSAPFVVSVHGNQDMELWSSICWDTAFSPSLNGLPMTGRAEVRWGELAEMLRGAFRVISGCQRTLSFSDLQHLKLRFFGNSAANDDSVVSWTRFCEDELSGWDTGAKNASCRFSFWEWVFHIAEMLQEKSGHNTKLKELWDKKYIYGFIDRREVDQYLYGLSEPAMIIRFSANHKAAISVSFRNQAGFIEHLKPFKMKEHIEKFSFPVIIQNIQQLQEVEWVLAKSEEPENPIGELRPKNEILALVESQKRGSQEMDSPYKPWLMTFQAVPPATSTLQIPKANRKRSGSSMELSPSPQPPKASDYDIVQDLPNLLSEPEILQLIDSLSLPTEQPFQGVFDDDMSSPNGFSPSSFGTM